MSFTGKFTGTLIEDLMATVERAEQGAQSIAVFQTAFNDATLVETSLAEPSFGESWLASLSDNKPDYDSRFIEVA